MFPYNANTFYSEQLTTGSKITLATSTYKILKIQSVSVRAGTSTVIKLRCGDLSSGTVFFDDNGVDSNIDMAYDCVNKPIYQTITNVVYPSDIYITYIDTNATSSVSTSPINSFSISFGVVMLWILAVYCTYWVIRKFM